MDWQTFKFWFAIALLFVVFGTLAFFIARWLEIENRLAFLGVLIAAYVILSMTVGYMRRRLRSDLEEMPAEERKASMASNRDADSPSLKEKVRRCGRRYGSA